VIAVAIVLGVSVLVLVAWLFGTRRALRDARHRGDDLSERLDAATREVERTLGELASAKSNLDDERKRVEQAKADTAAAQKEAEKSEAVARVATDRALELERVTIDASGWWALEAVRFDRAWRDHTAVGPSAPSPLAATDDPARTAVEILAEALREDSGTAIDVKWEAERVASAAPAGRLVRACEELLAVSRSADEGVITVRSGDEGTFVVSLRTEPSVALPPHVAAALEAAGSSPGTGPVGDIELTVATTNAEAAGNPARAAVV
jgi:hypothetical protein